MWERFTDYYLGTFIYGAFVWLLFLFDDHTLSPVQYLGFFLGFFIMALIMCWVHGDEYVRNKHNRF